MFLILTVFVVVCDFRQLRWGAGCFPGILFPGAPYCQAGLQTRPQRRLNNARQGFVKTRRDQAALSSAPFKKGDVGNGFGISTFGRLMPKRLTSSLSRACAPMTDPPVALAGRAHRSVVFD